MRIVKYMLMINNFLFLFIFRELLDFGLKFVIIFRYMVIGVIFRELMYSFWVVDNIILKFILIVLEVIVDIF